MTTRVCYISDERFPSRWTDTQQIMKTASALAKTGLNVDLVLPRKWPGTLFTDAETRKQILEKFYGVEALFDLTQIPSLPTTRIRLEKISHGFLSPAYTLLRQHDVVYTRNVMPLVLALAMGKYAILESHRVLKKHYPVSYLLIKLVRDHPKLLGVVTNAEMISASYHDMGFDTSRLLLAHNAFDPKDLEPRLSKDEAREQLGLPRDVGTVCYAGHIQKRKGIDMIIDIASRTPEIRYIICGGFSRDINRAKEIAVVAGAENLQFTGWIDVHKLAPYLFASDVLLIPPASAPLQQYGNTVLPIKTYTYLAVGRVIVAPLLTDTVEILKDRENALLVPPDDVEKAVEVIRLAVSDRKLASKMSKNALSLSNEFTWEARAVRIRRFIEDRLAAERPR